MERIEPEILEALKRIESYCLDDAPGCRKCKYHDICRLFPFLWHLEELEDLRRRT